MTHDFSTFFTMMTDEICAARQKHHPIHSLHEGYAVILEEMDELKEQVWLKAEKRDHANILEELVQIAAMAARVAVDCELLESDFPTSETSATQSYIRGQQGCNDVQVQGSAPIPSLNRNCIAALWFDAT